MPPIGTWWTVMPAILLGLFAHFKLSDTDYPRLWLGLFGSVFTGLIVYDLAAAGPHMEALQHTGTQANWFVNALVVIFPLVIVTAAAAVTLLAIAGAPMPLWEIGAVLGIGTALMVILAQASTDPGQASTAVNISAIQGTILYATAVGLLVIEHRKSTARRWRQMLNPQTC